MNLVEAQLLVGWVSGENTAQLWNHILRFGYAHSTLCAQQRYYLKSFAIPSLICVMLVLDAD